MEAFLKIETQAMLIIGSVWMFVSLIFILYKMRAILAAIRHIIKFERALGKQFSNLVWDKSKTDQDVLDFFHKHMEENPVMCNWGIDLLKYAGRQGPTFVYMMTLGT